jgi:hypothetical protein
MTLGTFVKAAALVAAGTMIGTARAGEEKLEIGKLPATVKAAIKARFPGAELKEAAKETEDGETFFEVTLTYKGDKYDVLFEPDGEIEEVERAIVVEALPSAVVKAVKAKYPKAKIAKAEELTNEEGEVAYEVVVADGKESREVVVSPKGKIKEAGEKDEDDEKGEEHEKKADKGEKEKKADKDEDDDDKHEKKVEKKAGKGEKEKKADKDDDEGEDDHKGKGKAKSRKGEKDDD